jgi:ATP-dependent Clp protease ATP-binding subunit ClpC
MRKLLAVIATVVCPELVLGQAMLERYSEQARRVLFFARAAVSEMGSRQVQPEHLLLGIIREGKGEAYALLFAKLGVDPIAVANDIESQIARRPRFDESIEVPISRSARRALIEAVEEADRLEHREIGTEHLLLGILRQAESVPTLILVKHGLTLDRARQAIRMRP